METMLSCWRLDGFDDRLTLDRVSVDDGNLRLGLLVGLHRDGVGVDRALLATGRVGADAASDDAANDAESDDYPDGNSPTGGVPVISNKETNRNFKTWE